MGSGMKRPNKPDMEIKVPIDIARRGDKRARDIFDAATHGRKTFNECLGEIYMIGVMAGAEAANGKA